MSKGDSVAYQDNTKRPFLLSTLATVGMVETRNARGKELTRPRVVVEYNKSMGGVDQSDARLYTYLFEGRTIKWTLKVFLSLLLLGRALLNSYILYCMNPDQNPNISRYEYQIRRR